MNAFIMGLLAETPLHPGSGQSAGAIDLPVSREAATGFPVVVGSCLKGALRDKVEQERGNNDPLVDEVFGGQANAGKVLVTDARLLLLPIRSFKRSLSLGDLSLHPGAAGAGFDADRATQQFWAYRGGKGRGNRGANR